MNFSKMQVSPPVHDAGKGLPPVSVPIVNRNQVQPPVSHTHTHWTNVVVQPRSLAQRLPVTQFDSDQTPTPSEQSQHNAADFGLTKSPPTAPSSLDILSSECEQKVNDSEDIQLNSGMFFAKTTNAMPHEFQGNTSASPLLGVNSGSDAIGYQSSKYAATELDPPPASPLSSVASFHEETSFEDSYSQDNSTSASSLKSPVSSPLKDFKESFQVQFDFDAPEGHDKHPVFRLKPTASQWADFPSILSFARSLGAAKDGCFKVLLPEELQGTLPQKGSQTVNGNAYKIRQIKRNGFWQVHTVPSSGLFEAPEPNVEPLEDVSASLQKLKKIFNKNKDKQIRSIRYRVDVPAWTEGQRAEAGVPSQSPIHPLKGDKLDQTKAVIPGIHTPYVYEANNHFGATFQIHAEDYRLVSLNHLYKGRKIWVVVPSTAVDIAEEAFGRKKKCSQFMRHRAEFFFPEKLEKMNIPYRIIDQRPGETIVILPDAYHEGFSTGYTLAEAKNYAESDWSTNSYQPCDATCQLITAIPEAFMAPLKDDEMRLDLCASYGGDNATQSPKRSLEDRDAGPAPEELNAKRVKI